MIGLAAPALALVAGPTHVHALLDDGTVMSWGSDEFGELGDGVRDFADCLPEQPCSRAPRRVLF